MKEIGRVEYLLVGRLNVFENDSDDRYNCVPRNKNDETENIIKNKESNRWKYCPDST